MTRRLLFKSTLAFSLVGTGACKTGKETLQQPLRVDSFVIGTSSSQGYFEAWLDVKGFLSNESASLAEPGQRRQGYRLSVDLVEILPKRATPSLVQVPVERRIPLEVANLPSGVYIVSVNGLQQRLEVPTTSPSSNPTAASRAGSFL